MHKKKLLVTLAALATGLIGLYSCNSKEETPAGGELEEIQVVLTLDTPVTKTINQENKTLWAEDDKISAIGTEYGEEEYVANYLTYRGENTFGGRITYPGNENNWYFVYPYREENVTPKEIHITVEQEQEQIGNDNMNHIAGTGFPLIGKVIDLKRTEQIQVHMANVLARLDYLVTNTLEDPIIVKQVVFTTPHKISGNFVGDMTSDLVNWNAASGTSNSVVLNVQEGTSIAKNETVSFHAGILPITLAEGESMKVKVMAVNPSAPNTDIVFYREIPVSSKTHLYANKTYDFTLNFDAAHSTDPNPEMDEPENPDDPQNPDEPQNPDQPTGEAAYVKVTSEPTSWDGTYLIVDENSSKAFAAFSANASSYAVNVTITDGKVLATDAVAKYAFTISDAGVKHANATSQEAYNIRNSEGKYIFWSSSTLQILDTNQKTAGGGSSSDLYTYYSTLAYSNNGVQVMSSGHSSGFSKYYLGYESSAFNYDSDGESRRVQLYKLTEGTTPSDPSKLNQPLSFAQSTVTLTMATAGGSQAVQTVSGAQTNVSYASSNPDVATVSGTTITITGFGSTTITATAEESATYNSASASYTLVIQQESTTGSERTYTYQTSVSAGTYLLGGYESSNNGQNGQYSIALFPTVITGNWESSQGSVTNGQYIGQRDIDSSNTLTFSNDNEIFNAEVELIASGNNWKIKILSTGEYLTVPTQDNRITYTTSESSATAFSISAGTGTGSGYGMGTGSSSTMGISSGNYYFYHSSSAHGFSMRAYQVTNIRLYKKTSESGTSGNQNQTLTFAQSTVTETRSTASGTMSVQTVSGNKTTPVQYSSSNPDVATINGTTITITGFGSTVITATAPAGNGYNSGSASYTLVIQKSSGGETPTSTERTYTYQSSASAGTYLLGGYESEGSKYSIALFPTVITGNWNSSQGNVTNGQYIGQRDIDSSNTLTFNNDSEIFNAEVELIASGSNWKIKILSTGEYLTVPSQDNRITYTSSESSATAFTIGGSDTGSSWGGGNWGGTSSGNTLGIYSGSYYFYHSSSAQGYSMRAYQVTNIRLYKKTSEGGTSGGGTTGNQDQTLTFAQSTVTETRSTASGTMSVQTVSGNKTTPVQYSSSNPSVATVNGTTITITGFGSTVITATAPAGNGYNSGSASYTLYIQKQSSGGDNPSGERTYTYVAPGSLQEGTYLIAGSESNELSVALFPNVSSKSWNSQQTGQVNDGQYIPHKVVGTSNSANTITSTDSDVIASEVELVKSGNNWRFLVKSTNQYLASPSAEYRISFTSNASSAATFEVSSGTNGATIQTGSYYFYHSGSAGGFTMRTSSTANVRFYQLTSGGGTSSGKQYQTLSFANSSETLTLDSATGDYQVQKVSGAQTTVTYSSSNTSVATVSGTTLTIKGFGSTEITANAESNDQYYSASKSYTLTVKRLSQTGVYNLENAAIEDYLDRAEAGYTYDNHGSGTGGGNWWGGGSSSSDGVSYVSTILNTYGNPSASNRIDWPAPATVTWTQSVSNPTLAVYYDEAHTNEEIMAVAEISSTSADIYNLIPGKTYYWVLKSGNSTVASGHFETEGRRRMVGVGKKSNYGNDFANNCRDLGGQVTTSGKKLKYGKIFRGSNMDGTTDAQKTYLKTKMKIGLDVDLRSGSNSSSSQSHNNALNLAKISEGDANTYQGWTPEQYSSGSDLKDPSRMRLTLTRIFNAVHNNVNVYIHCYVGADRTGGTCLYLESILGVAPERCDMDFEMTSFSSVGSRTRNGSSPEQYYTVYSAIKNTNTGNDNSTWQEKAIYYCVNTLGVDRNAITQFQNDMLE